MRIDSHVHLWDPARGDYGWLDNAPDALRRPFGAGDLAPLLKRHRVGGVVLVQAAPTVAETDYMLAIADRTAWVLGVVGWIDFAAPSAFDDLARLSAHPKLRGIRPMVQDIPDDDWVLNPDFTPVFDEIARRNLVFDALGFPRYVARFTAIADRHPRLTMVIDHAMKPAVGEDLAAWRADMRELARRRNPVCKLSGLVTEGKDGWAVDALRPIVDHLLEVYGPDRLLFGSDWPVVTLAASYDAWFEAADTLLSGLAAHERAQVFGENAAEVYGLDAE
jgi:L-fuconolactonase